MIVSTFRLPSVDSTNTWALNWLRSATEEELGRELPKMVVADQQTAGRGRHGKSWFAAEDGLACTLIAKASPELLSIAVGVALAETIEMVAGPTTVHLKWPNDVWMNGSKVAGILIERHGDASSDGEPVFAIGIGCNLGKHPEMDQIAGGIPPTSILNATGRLISKDQLLDTLGPHLLEVIGEVDEQPKDVVQRFENRNVLRGHTVRCMIGGQAIEGICEGLHGDGSLILRTASGLQFCSSGEVQQVRTRPLG
ncbi:biotin--[acetyl-CoA-carboxylase] ligase [Rhodopirellula europaea]|uniref:biotin--[biotin carboxyl-carrier protein] ligase n=1 Tax=Rhodopirellula europaea 6C TaxID=1263867 RepID=M2B498_9BACT|nr:biotin--[acetyl-CoA-carboxylase] ligase [Rhodopirellula europaea]EMB17019.1 biotin--acetyl-CoA-carboxylase ligase [Rhodopirellula europaea 6C]